MQASNGSNLQEQPQMGEENGRIIWPVGPKQKWHLVYQRFYIWIEQLEKEVKPEKALLTKLRQKCQAF